MREYLCLGLTPGDEPCAQITAVDYYDKYKAEGKRYIELLEKIFGETKPLGVSFRIKSFPYEPNEYHEVCVFYDDEDNVGVEFAYHVENNIPEKWTDDEEIPFEAPDRESYPDYDDEELETEVRNILGD